MPALDQNTIRLLMEYLSSSEQLLKLFEFYVSQLESESGESTEATVFALLTDDDFGKPTTEMAAKPQGQRAKMKSLADARARNANKRLRSELIAFFNTDIGRRLPVHLQVPKSRWCLEATQKSPNVLEFWRPYLSLEPPTNRVVPMVYTEHLFFSHQDASYLVRHPEVNDISTDFAGKIPELQVSADLFVPTRQFVNASEVQALHRLSSVFLGLTVPTELLPAHAPGLRGALFGRNLIALGNPRTSPFIDQLQREENLNFQFGVQNITVRNPEKVEQDTYPTPYNGARLLYVTVSRFFSMSLRALVTLISANHGRAISAAAHALTAESLMDQLLRQLQATYSIGPQDQFELLLAVHPPPKEDSAMRGYRTDLVAARSL